MLLKMENISDFFSVYANVSTKFPLKLIQNERNFLRRVPNTLFLKISSVKEDGGTSLSALRNLSMC